MVLYWCYILLQSSQKYKVSVPAQLIMSLYKFDRSRLHKYQFPNYWHTITTHAQICSANNKQ